MTELDRVLDVFLHDLRSPLSVASGCVRLLRMEKLDTFEARDRAWTLTATALGRIASLCDEAVGFLSSSEAPVRSVPAAQLVARVCRHCQERGITCDTTVSADDREILHTRTDVDRLALAVTTVAALNHSDTAPARISARLVPGALTFTVPWPDTGSADGGDPLPFDPWAGPGLSRALACHAISLASGSVRVDGALIISFPLQESAS